MPGALVEGQAGIVDKSSLGRASRLDPEPRGSQLLQRSLHEWQQQNMKELHELRWRSVSALSSVHQSTKGSSWAAPTRTPDLHSTPDGREGQPLLIQREFPTNPMEMGSESDLKSKKVTSLAQLSWWKKYSYSLEAFALRQHLNTLQRWTFGADLSQSPTREIQKGTEDRQVKTRWWVTYLSWKLSQFPLHYSRRAFEHHLLPQKKVKTLGSRDRGLR